jgi:tetratricopeptide (TPR) repeat protein
MAMYRDYIISQRSGPKDSWPWWISIVILGGGLILAGIVWYAASPDSFARTYGRFLGPPLKVESLDLQVGSRLIQVSDAGTLEIKPQDILTLKGLNTNRWKNYDLLFYSPDFDINAVVRGEARLVSLLGEEAFLEPKTVSVEVREGSRMVAVFYLKAAYAAADFGALAQSSVEVDRKIGYYRKALELEPGSPAWQAGLREALGQAGQKEELIGLLEDDLAKSSDDNKSVTLLADLLDLYRNRQDKAKEIVTLERLLSLARKNGQPTEGLKNNLAILYRPGEPKKAARFYEELSSDPEVTDPARRMSYLGELLAVYRETEETDLEEKTYQRLLPMVSADQVPGVWTEIIRLREKLGDRPGQLLAWEELAKVLPPGEHKANAYKRLGFFHYENKDFDKSEQAYFAAMEHDQDDAAVYLNLARLAQAENDRPGYRDFLAKAVFLDETLELRLELAQAYTDDGLINEAKAAWQSLATQKGTGETLKIRRLAQSQLVGLFRPPAGQLSSEFERQLYLYSLESVEFYNLGITHFQHKNWDQAVKAFLRALELDHQRQLEEDARGYLLALYKEKGQTKEMLEQANWLYPGNPAKKEIRDLIADQYERDKDWNTLVKVATEWTGQDDDAENWRYLALAQKQTGQDKGAAQSLLKLAQKDSKAKNWFEAAEALRKVGNSDQAKTAYEKVLELEPNNTKAESALVKMAVDAVATGRNGRK